MKNVKELLDEKGTQVWSVTQTDSVHDALTLMTDKNIGAVLVMDQGGLVGILSERDFTRGVVERGDNTKNMQAKEIMTGRPVCVGPDQTLDECMALMTDKRVRHLPVVQNGQVIGLVSIGDAVKATISEQQFLIEQLERYISS